MDNTLYKQNPKSLNKKYREYFLPTVLNVMAVNLAAVVDSIIAGNMLGQEALGAIGLVFPVIQLYATLTTMLGIGITSSASKAKGENLPAKANRLYSSGIITAGVLCLLLMTVQLTLFDSICGLLAGSTGLTGQMRAYYLPFVIATPLEIFTGLSAYILRTDGRPKFSANIIIISNVVNLCMDILYMGVFNMGIMGSSIATATGQAVALCILSSHFIKKKNTLHFDKSVFKLKKCFESFKEIITTGISAAMGQLLLVVKIQFMLYMLRKLEGGSGVIAFQVYINALQIISMFIGGGSQSMIPIVSMCIGERDYEGVRYTFRQAVKIMLSAAVVIVAAILLFPRQIAMLFGIENPDVMTLCESALRLTAVSFFGVTLSFLMLYYYTAVGMKKISMTISTMNTVGFVIPSALLMSFLFGTNGLWLSFILSEVLTIIMIFIIKTVKIKRSNGKYPDFYMIPKSDETTVMSLSFKANGQNAAGVSDYIMNVLREHKTAMAVEDMTAKFSAEMDGDVLIDVRIIKDEKTVIAIRYNGKAYNPLLEESDDIADAVNIVRSLSEDIEYSSVLGFNRIMITLK